jgi:hypothetical protein
MASAEPVVRLTWGVGQHRWCPPAFDDLPATPGSLLPAYVTVVGHEDSHTDWRLEFEMFPADGGAYPDAWRVDSLGCALDALAMFFTPPPIETCLAPFYPASLSLLAPRTSTRFDPLTNRLRISVWVGIAPPHTDPNPTAIYVLGTFVFDHARSVIGAADGETACGDVERTFCVRLNEASYLDSGGTWKPWIVDPAVISANGVSGSPCGVVAAVPSTWGTIKARYR